MENEDSQKVELGYWGIPDEICKEYLKKKVTKLYKWQVECLLQPNVLEGGHLVYSAPTSSGKTLVAEILILKMLLKLKKKAIIILPFVAVVEEKVKFMKDVFKGFEVEGFFANKGSMKFGEDDNVDIAICTIEKANSLINRLADSDKLTQIGCIVIDEIHLMGEQNRGYLIELLVTKLMFLQVENLQLIGLSATLPDLQIFKKWMKCEIYSNSYRPIPLDEHLVIGKIIYNKQLQEKEKIEAQEVVQYLTQQVVAQNLCVLVFCPSKRACEVTCSSLARFYKEKQEKSVQERTDLLNRLLKTPAGLDPILEHSIPFGIAYHHAGLTTEERSIIEDGFRESSLLVLVCTSTLAAGVNLPARRVIITSPYIAFDPLDINRYKQMCGRAGRSGKDTKGESFLLCGKAKTETVKNLFQQDSIPNLDSCFHQNKRGLSRAFLEGIILGLIHNSPDVKKFLSCTLLFSQIGENEINKAAQIAIKYLESNELIKLNYADDSFKPTKKGEAVVSSGLSPEEGVAVFSELSNANHNFALGNDLHLIYELTPIFHDIEPNWDKFESIYSHSSREIKEVGKLVGIDEGFLTVAPTMKVRPSKQVDIHKRFFAALILLNLINEEPIASISKKFNVARGRLQSLQTSGATFAGMVQIFCNKLGWWAFELLIKQFSDRLNFGVQMDLIPLVQIPFVKNKRARILFKAGYQTVNSIANANPEEIRDILANTIPFKPKKELSHDSEYFVKAELRLARLMVDSAKKIVKHQAKTLLTSAQLLSSPYSPTKQFEVSFSQLSPQVSPILTISPQENLSNTKSNSKKRSLDINFQELNNDDNYFLPLVSSNKKRKKNSPKLIYFTEDETNNQQFSQFSKDLFKQEICSFKVLFSVSLSEKMQARTRYIEGVSLFWNSEEIFFLDFGNTESSISERNKNSGKLWNIFIDFMENKNISKICFNIKPQILLLLEYKISILGKLVDPFIACWLLAPRDNFEISLDTICCKFDGDLNHNFNQKNEIEKCLLETIKSFFVSKNLIEELKIRKLNFVFEKIEMKVITNLAEIEYWGIGFSKQNCKKPQNLVEQRLLELEEKIFELCGTKFDISNPSETSSILYGKSYLNLKPHRKIQKNSIWKNIKQDHKIFQTKARVLKNYSNPVPILVKEYRSLKYILEQNIKKLPKFSEKKIQQNNTDRIYSTSIQTASSTGRILIENPNLQIIPNKKEFPSTIKEYYETDSIQCKDGISIRESFIAKQGFKLLSADFCQIELRILAHLSQDQKLLSIFHDDFVDPFIKLASKWLGKKEDDITKIDRDKAKKICYAVIYGMGAKSISEELQIDFNEAEKLRSMFLEKFNGVTKYLQQIIDDCRQNNGYTFTMAGRQKHFPKINSGDKSERLQAEREATNAVIQGTSADLVKISMIKISKKIKIWKKFEYLPFKNPALNQKFSTIITEQKIPRCVLHVHDELIFEIPVENLKTIQKIIVKEMGDCFKPLESKFRVPLKVKLRIGETWENLKLIEIDS